MSLDPSSFDDIRQEIAKIASRYGVFQCIECSQAIKEFLIARNLHGKQIKLDLGRQDLPWAVFMIYDDSSKLLLMATMKEYQLQSTERKLFLII